MADAPRSSFIPKQVAQNATPGRVRKRRTFNNLAFVGNLFLGISILLAVGTFAYKYYITTTLEDARAQLEAEQGRFSEADFNTVYAFNRHLDAAEFLLDRHSAPSKIFAALEESTKQSIQYTDFELRRSTGGDITVTLDGATDAFGKIVLQNLQYVQSDILRGATVTGVSLGAEAEGEVVSDEEVIFKVSSNVSATDIGYTAPVVVQPVVEEVPEPEVDLASTTPEVEVIPDIIE